MCGILAQFLKNNQVDPVVFKSALNLMSSRGPDAHGEVRLGDRLMLGHKRLSIVDLSALGNQPMSDPDGKFTLVFNGEIYNYLDLRFQLEALGCSFASNTDTEVVLWSYIVWGRESFKKFNGPFAICIFDSFENELVVARDRCGEKPLFYLNNDSTFVVSSSLVAASRLAELRSVDISSVASYLINGYSGRTKTLINGILQLEPGTILVYRLETGACQIKNFWDVPGLSPYNLPFPEVVESTQRLLVESIKRQLHCDVPACVLLSGGLDSSLITSIASSVKTKVDTFTVKFSGYNAFDESKSAREIADYFGTNHTEIEGSDISPELFEKVVASVDSPVNDSSLLPTFSVYQSVSSTCRVALGGDGGDELFGGYKHYSRLLILDKLKKVLPFKLFLRQFLNQVISDDKRSKNWLDCITADLETAIPNIRRIYGHRLLSDLGYVSAIQNEVDRSWQRVAPYHGSVLRIAIGSDFANYLPSSILVKSDRMSMANSVEARAPFLDTDLLNFCFSSIPDRYKASCSARKIVLREIAKNILPPGYDVKRKLGFNLPFGDLIKSASWKKYIYNVIDSEPDLQFRNFVGNLYGEHLAGINHSDRLFGAILLSRWININNYTCFK